MITSTGSIVTAELPKIVMCVYYWFVVRVERYLELADIATVQWGLLTTAQARQVNVNAQQVARLAHSGVLQRLQHGVYRLAGIPDHPLTDLRAAWLGLEPDIAAADRLARPDPGGIASYRSAARIHRLGDLDVDVNEFSTTTPRRTRQSGARLHTRTLDAKDWQIVDGLPVTTVAATLGDLAATNTDSGHLGAALRDAILHGQINYRRAVTQLRPHAHRYGAPLADGDALARTLLTQAGLTQTINAVKEHGDEWLAEQLDKAGVRVRAADVLVKASHQCSVEAELARYSGLLDQRPQLSTAPANDSADL